MKIAIIAGLTFLTTCTAFAESEVDWSYSGARGPDNWAELSEALGACDGKNQSPIDLRNFVEADLAPIKLSYQPGGNEILNNGHTVQVNYAEGSSLIIDGIRFELKQFHFHSPSENWINGKSYPMELHIVHLDNKGNPAVVAIMFTEGDENAALANAWSHMPESSGDLNALPSPIMTEGLLPPNRDYYRFNGSLTTPPCTEGVRWLVMKDSVSVSKEQLRAFTQVMRHPNNRPLQPINARAVLQ